MRGRILSYSSSDFKGLIAGQDSQRYDFVRLDWKAAGEPAVGMDVDFRPDVTTARDIFLAAPGFEQPPRPAQPPFGQPGQHGQPFMPPPKDMGFGEAVSICFKKYATFAGRARRAEYWYFVLFSTLARLVTTILDAGVGMRGTSGGPFTALLSLALFIPSLAVLTRRMHDTDRSGFWVLGFYGVVFACLIGIVAAFIVQTRSGVTEPGAVGAMIVLGLVMLAAAIWILVITVTKGTTGSNRYGPDPLSEPADVF